MFTVSRGTLPKFQRFGDGLVFDAGTVLGDLPAKMCCPIYQCYERLSRWAKRSESSLEQEKHPNEKNPLFRRIEKFAGSRDEKRFLRATFPNFQARFWSENGGRMTTALAHAKSLLIPHT